MNEDLNEDLKWLAENRNEWIKSAKSCDVDRSSGAVSWRGDKKGSINRTQWQAARDELGLNHSVEPTEKVWRGPEDGLPPVGTVCNVETVKKLYVGCIITYQGEGFTCFKSNGIEYVNFRNEIEDFYPIRSEEDNAVEEMVSYIYGLPVEDKRKAEHAARVLYRAGYRKQEDK